jgi:hypothetical protein
LRRVVRDRPRTVAVALLALVSIAAAGVNGTAAERLQSLLDENWRGAYDILVTKSDVSEMFDGVLTPTALVSSDIRGLPLSAIDEVRGIDDVEVASSDRLGVLSDVNQRSGALRYPAGHGPHRAGPSGVPGDDDFRHRRWPWVSGSSPGTS